MKKCRKCGETKPLSEFNNSKDCKDGKFSQCKSCARAGQKAWRDANSEKIKAERREKYAANPEPTREFMRERYWRDPDARRAETAKWREKNPEKNKKGLRAWYLSNTEHAKAATRKRFYEKHEECLAKGRIRSREHYRKNKDRYFEMAADRRARVSGVRGRLSKGIRKHLREKQHDRCVYCNCELGVSPHLDHVIPLAKGGAHTDDNVQLLCQSCNLSKGAKMPDEFLRHRERIALIKGVE